MAKPVELFEKWNKKTPTDASFQDVEKVAMHYLGEQNIRTSKTGSHQLIIKGPITKIAVMFRDGGYSGLAWLQGDSISISTVSGKSVKKTYVEQLIKMINFKTEYDKNSEEQKRED